MNPLLVTMIGGPGADTIDAVALEHPMTIAEAIASRDIKFRLPTIAVVSGIEEPAPVLRGQWNLRVIRPGETLSLIAVPGKSNSSGKQIAMLVAAIALSVAAPFVGTQVAAAMGFAGNAVVAGIASTAFMAAGPVVTDATKLDIEAIAQRHADEMFNAVVLAFFSGDEAGTRSIVDVIAAQGAELEAEHSNLTPYQFAKLGARVIAIISERLLSKGANIVPGSGTVQ